MKTLVRDASGERLIWWHWQNLAKAGQSRNARAWLHFGNNAIGVQWVFKPKRFSLCLECAHKAVDDDSLSFSISIIGVIALYFSIANLRIVERLPGVKWQVKDYYSGHREISIVYLPSENHWMHWRLWRNPHIGNSNDWRDEGLFWDDVIFGRAKYSEMDLDSQPCKIAMPEGEYEATARRFVATWTRKRWSTPKSVNRVKLDIPKGIGAPGHGENSWDQEDDATFNFTTVADTVEDAIVNLRENLLRERKKYGGEDWTPVDGVSDL